MKALERAIRTAPTMAEFARRVGVSPQVVANWKKRGIPARYALAIERATNGTVSRHDVAPDFYPEAA